MAASRTPAHLGADGRKLWRDISTKYELRADELRVLADACAEADLVARLDEALSVADVMIAGSMGQAVVNPLFAEVRQHRNTLAGLLAKLKLPDDGESGEDRSTKAREAANSRWRRGA